jgi:glycosyltransferase involved in cell wall biosynthesis
VTEQPTDDVTVLVPAYNEAGRIDAVIRELRDAAYRVLVVDDGSTDDTAAVAADAGATVVTQPTNRGYVAALRRGFREVETPITVTFDADGEHRVADVPSLVAPIRRDEADLVFGSRGTIPRPSERFLNWIATRKVDVTDTTTGFRAIRTPLAKRLSLDTACTCGTFALEAATYGARIDDVQIETAAIDKPRGVAWNHGRQLLDLLQYYARVE